ncbi:hypothetical protein A7K92_26740 [Klebsiella pneumoniae]|nr:hypothetical protein A7K92_26740 [Klebsiella pneumoniae]
MWPIYYAMASDSAEERATSTANGIITTAMFIGGGIFAIAYGLAHSVLAAAGENPAGYIYAFFTMAGQCRVAYLLRHGVGLRRRTRHLYR